MSSLLFLSVLFPLLLVLRDDDGDVCVCVCVSDFFFVTSITSMIYKTLVVETFSSWSTSPPLLPPMHFNSSSF